MPKEPGRLVSLNSPRRGGQVPEPGVDDLRFWEREGDGGWLTAGDPYVKEDGPMAAMLAPIARVSRQTSTAGPIIKSRVRLLAVGEMSLSWRVARVTETI